MIQFTTRRPVRKKMKNNGTIYGNMLNCLELKTENTNCLEPNCQTLSIFCFDLRNFRTQNHPSNGKNGGQQASMEELPRITEMSRLVRIQVAQLSIHTWREQQHFLEQNTRGRGWVPRPLYHQNRTACLPALQWVAIKKNNIHCGTNLCDI